MKIFLAIILTCFCFIKANGSATYNYLFSTNAVATNTYTIYYGSEQGCYNDGTNEFFNDTFNLWFPNGTNLSGSNTVVIPINGFTNYNGLNYAHLGDPDYAYGKVYVPLSGTNTAIAVFQINYATSNFTLLSVNPITNQTPSIVLQSGFAASTLTVDEQHGLIYVFDFADTNHSYTNLSVYSTNFTFIKTIALSTSIKEIQGSKYYNGVLLVQSDLGLDGSVSNANIWAISPDTGNCSFIKTITSSFTGTEVEGLDALGTNLIVQGITSQFGTDLTSYPITISPILTVTYSGNNVKVSWPSDSTGFVLQQNPDLNMTNWTTSSYTISDDSTNKSITITSPAGNLFFRLAHP